MNNIKKAGIVTGAVIGGAIGGTISFIGKMSKKDFIDELGENIIDSTILTGTVAGDLASGATNVIAGKVKSDEVKVKEGFDDFKDAGNQVVSNIVDNFQNTIESGEQVIKGVIEKDADKIKEGAKNLVKMTAIGLITVGAVKISDKEQSKGKDKDKDKDKDKEKSKDTIKNNSKKEK